MFDDAKSLFLGSSLWVKRETGVLIRVDFLRGSLTLEESGSFRGESFGFGGLLGVFLSLGDFPFAIFGNMGTGIRFESSEGRIPDFSRTCMLCNRSRLTEREFGLVSLHTAL